MTDAFALDSHRAAHQFGQLLADGQPQAGAAVLARRADVGLAEAAGTAARCPASESPMPVSRTAKCSSSPPLAVAHTVSATSPCSVNFTALLSRFSRTWRSRVTSPSMTAGTSPSTRRDVGETLFSAARLAIRSSADSHAVAQVEGVGLDVQRPASIFEKSRMSLMIVSSASPRVADRRRVVALLGGQLRVQQQRRSCR